MEEKEETSISDILKSIRALMRPDSKESKDSEPVSSSSDVFGNQSSSSGKILHLEPVVREEGGENLAPENTIVTPSAHTKASPGPNVRHSLSAALSAQEEKKPVPHDSLPLKSAEKTEGGLELFLEACLQRKLESFLKQWDEPRLRKALEQILEKKITAFLASYSPEADS